MLLYALLNCGTCFWMLFGVRRPLVKLPTYICILYGEQMLSGIQMLTNISPNSHIWAGLKPTRKAMFTVMQGENFVSGGPLGAVRDKVLLSLCHDLKAAFTNLSTCTGIFAGIWGSRAYLKLFLTNGKLVTKGEKYLISMFFQPLPLKSIEAKYA